MYKQFWLHPCGTFLVLMNYDYIQLFRERLSETNVHATIPKGNMGYEQLLFFSTRKHASMTSRTILSNFFKKQWTQNRPQYLSGFSRALSPTTFLEIAV